MFFLRILELKLCLLKSYLLFQTTILFVPGNFRNPPIFANDDMKKRFHLRRVEREAGSWPGVLSFATVTVALLILLIHQTAVGCTADRCRLRPARSFTALLILQSNKTMPTDNDQCSITSRNCVCFVATGSMCLPVCFSSQEESIDHACRPFAAVVTCSRSSAHLLQHRSPHYE